jgi:hypothetical protein
LRWSCGALELVTYHNDQATKDEEVAGRLRACSTFYSYVVTMHAKFIALWFTGPCVCETMHWSPDDHLFLQEVRHEG